MKRTTIIVSLALILMLAGIPALAATVSAPAAATTEAKPNPAISFDQAISLAKAAAPGHELMSLSLDDEHGLLIYEAELINLTDGSKVDMILDAATGKVIPNDQADEINGAADETAKLNDETADVNDENTGDNNESTGKNDKETDDHQKNELDENTDDAALMAKAVVTFEQARDFVLRTNAGAQITEIELEDESGLPVYKVEFFNANGQKAEIILDAVNGTKSQNKEIVANAVAGAKIQKNEVIADTVTGATAKK